MLCESCHEQPATVHLTTIAGGEKTEQHLCAACCQKHKQAIAVAGMNSLLAGLLQGTAQTTASTLRCSSCGQTYEQFRKTGTLGCAQCYQDFRTQLKPMLERIHGRVQHAGRVPKQADEINRARLHMEDLRREMERAVASEDFERAAQLRDELRAMQPAKEDEKNG